MDRCSCKFTVSIDRHFVGDPRLPPFTVVSPNFDPSTRPFPLLLRNAIARVMPTSFLTAPSLLSRPPSRRPRISPRIPPCLSLQATRTSVGAVNPVTLKQLAEAAETRGTVLALHSDTRSLLLELHTSVDLHNYNLAWPSSAPAWPYTRLPSTDDPSKSAPALLATARAVSAEHAQIVRVRVAATLRDSIARGELLAGIVLVDAQDPGAFLVCTVHDPDIGACFDPEMAGADWTVSKYAAVHPPLAAWCSQTRIGDSDASIDVPVSHTAERALERDTAAAVLLRPDAYVAGKTAEGPGDVARTSDFAPKALLSYGSGAIDGAAIRMRDVSDIKDGEPLRIFMVSGWNESRIQPLNIECETPYENGHLTYVVGVNVHAGSATLRTLREAVHTARITNPHVVAALGGGAVMDGAKALGALIAQSDEDVDVALKMIEEGAERGEREITVRLEKAARPVVLIPGTIGAGAELCEAAMLVADVEVRGRPGERFGRHSIFVTFDYVGGVRRKATERTAVVDPRVVSPRRLNGEDAAQGGLMALAGAVDSLLCANSSPQTEKLAFDALQYASDALLCARREPTTGDGEPRDALLRATCAAALARDAVGPGIGILLTMAVMDSLRDKPQDGEFRQIYARIVASIVRKACGYEVLGDVLLKAARVVTGDHLASGTALADWIIRRAEDIGVPQMKRLGVRSCRALQNVRQLAEMRTVRHPPHPSFYDADVLVDVVEDAISNQPFEL